MTEPLLFPLCKVDASQKFEGSVEKIGGKAHSLLTMGNAELPVPPAYVIPISVCEDYFAANQQLPNNLIPELHSAIEKLEAATGCRWESELDSLRLAVRSGAAVSMPGTLETILNVERWDDLVSAICRVFDSWMSPAAQAYRKALRLQHLSGTAVIVQHMFDAEVSGVLFTRDPTNRQSDHIYVEAVHGTGDRLVSGAEEGQRWRMDRKSCEVIFAADDCESEPLLQKDQLHRLAQTGLQLERLFDQSVDVEWGLRDDQLVFFQARPIIFSSDNPSQSTDLEQSPCTEATLALQELVERENKQLAIRCAAGEPFWVRHNLCETLPFPTPLTWSIIEEFMKGSGGFGQLYRQLGFSPSRRICRDGFLELIGGQIYASPARLPDLFCTDYPFSYSKDAIRHDPSLIDRAPKVLDLDRVGPWFLLQSPGISWMIFRTRRRLQRLRKTVEKTFQNEFLPEYRTYLNQERNRILESLSITELIELLRQRKQNVLQKSAPHLMLPGLIGSTLFEQLRCELANIGNETEANELCIKVLSSLNLSGLSEFQRAVDCLKQGTLSTQLFLDRYGYRSAHDMELAEPRWSEDIDTSFPSARQFSASVDVGNAALDPGALLESFLKVHSASRKAARLRELLADALRLLQYRELGKEEFLRGYTLLRDVTEQLGRVTQLGNSIYFLRVEELTLWNQTDMANLISNRKSERDLWQTMTLPVVLDENGICLMKQRAVEHLVVLHGTVISAGIAHGQAWFPEQHRSELPPENAILICTSLPPQLVSTFHAVQAIAVDQSALLSHGAILARQFRIVVVSHPQVTQRIQDGDAIQIDGHTGRITVDPMSI